MLPISNHVKSFNDVTAKLPEQVLQSIHEMNHYSPRVYPPFKGCGMQHHYYNRIIDNSYATLAVALDNNAKYDGVILIPRIRTGGTDKLLKSYLSVLSNNMDLNILIICEDSTSSEWTPLFESMADVLYLDSIYDSKIPQSAKIASLNMVIEMMSPRFVWGFNSRLAYVLFSTYGKSLKEVTNLWVVVFAHWIHEISYREFGMVHDYLPRIKENISYVISDNSRFVDLLVQQYNLTPEKLKYVASPNSLNGIDFYPKVKRSKLRLLWASGIEWNKGIEVLSLIGHELKKRNLPVEIEVYGRPKNNDGVKLLEVFKKNTASLETVVYKDGFSNFQSLGPESYDGFIFTSMIEGMPNILLEAAENQMFIISSLVGGIGDLIEDGNTGILIQDCFDVNSYVNAIEELLQMSNESYNDIRKNLVSHYNSRYVADVATQDFSNIIA